MFKTPERMICCFPAILLAPVQCHRRSLPALPEIFLLQKAKGTTEQGEVLQHRELHRKQKRSLEQGELSRKQPRLPSNPLLGSWKKSLFHYRTFHRETPARLEPENLWRLCSRLSQIQLSFCTQSLVQCITTGTDQQGNQSINQSMNSSPITFPGSSTAGYNTTVSKYIFKKRIHAAQRKGSGNCLGWKSLPRPLGTTTTQIHIPKCHILAFNPLHSPFQVRMFPIST